MVSILAVPAGIAMAWVLAPIVDVAVRGTQDARAVAAMRATTCPAARVARDAVIPHPRVAADSTLGAGIPA